jgi:hypothetical protein
LTKPDELLDYPRILLFMRTQKKGRAPFFFYPRWLQVQFALLNPDNMSKKILHYVMKFVSQLWQVGVFLRVLRQ